MKMLSKDDLQKRIPPRLDSYQSVAADRSSGIGYWSKSHYYRELCEAKNGYVCQRSAAAGAASDASGKSGSLEF